MDRLALDWRSPGDFWVKTSSGSWQKLDALRANVNRHIRRLGINRNKDVDRGSQNDLNNQNNQAEYNVGETQKELAQQGNAPDYLGNPLSRYLLIPRGRGKGVYITIGEVMLKLDFSGAVHDPRRYNYVCRMLELLVSSHFNCFSGSAQKNLLYVIEETVDVAIETQKNLRRVRRIVSLSIKELEKQRYSYIGTPTTWKARLDRLDDLLNRLNKVKIPVPESSEGLAITGLPDECIRLIFRRLADHEDIVNTGATDKKMHGFSNDTLLWKQFCHFHFTKEQILREIGLEADENTVRWKACYHKLYKRYGRKELYADMLHVCGHCNCLFWKNGGHPCSLETAPEGSKRMYDPSVPIPSIPMTPQQFLQLFPSA